MLAAILSLVCLLAPVPGDVESGFAPVGRWGGHWGVDLAVGRGGTVRAPVSGTVTFAGTVAGVRSVTVGVDGVRVSLSYLDSISVAEGEQVTAGEVVGRAGSGEGHGGTVHLSVREGGAYVDPSPLLGCRPVIRLLPADPYPARSRPGAHAPRSSRRDL